MWTERIPIQIVCLQTVMTKLSYLKYSQYWLAEVLWSFRRRCRCGPAPSTWEPWAAVTLRPSACKAWPLHCHHPVGLFSSHVTVWTYPACLLWDLTLLKRAAGWVAASYYVQFYMLLFVDSAGAGGYIFLFFQIGSLCLLIWCSVLGFASHLDKGCPWKGKM